MMKTAKVVCPETADAPVSCTLTDGASVEELERSLPYPSRDLLISLFLCLFPCPRPSLSLELFPCLFLSLVSLLEAILTESVTNVN